MTVKELYYSTELVKLREYLRDRLGNDYARLVEDIERRVPLKKESATFVYVGSVFGEDPEGDVLVDWDSDEHNPTFGSQLFVCLQYELLHRASELCSESSDYQ